MKTFKITILGLLFICNVNAQQREDIAYYNAKIDSIVSVLSTEALFL